MTDAEQSASLCVVGEPESERESRDPVLGEGNLSSFLRNRQLPPLLPADPANLLTSFPGALRTLPLPESNQCSGLPGSSQQRPEHGKRNLLS